MKRLWLLVLCLSFLISCMTILGGCSSEPVAFSEKLRDDKECYIDVVEIQPDFEDAFIYCRCTLSDGSEAWMEIFDTDYKEYFDNDTDSDEIVYMPNGVTYDAPVRLNGRAKRVDDVINDSGKKITVFRFADADLSATTDPTDRTYCATSFNQDLKVGKFVVADITNISYFASVETTTSTETMTLSGELSVVCRATLKDGESIYILIYKSDYQKYFDQNADFDKTTPASIEFAQPVSIYGTTIDTKDEFNNLGMLHNEGIVFAFRSAVAADIDAAKIQNQPAVPFSDALKEKQPVYVEIESITAEYTVRDVLSPFAQEYYVCRCQTADKKEVWMYIFSGTFKTQFLEVYGETEDQTATITLETPIKVNGRVYCADSIASDLSAKISTDVVIYFSEIA